MISKCAKIISLSIVWIVMNTSHGLCGHFSYHKSDDSYSILILSATCLGMTLENGDEIGVFALDGSGSHCCAGAVVLTEGQPPVGLSAWVDDSQTAEKDGFIQGEIMEFRVWDASEQTEYFATAEYIQGDGTWGYGVYTIIHNY